MASRRQSRSKRRFGGQDGVAVAGEEDAEGGGTVEGEGFVVAGGGGGGFGAVEGVVDNEGGVGGDVRVRAAGARVTVVESLKWGWPKTETATSSTSPGSAVAPT